MDADGQHRNRLPVNEQTFERFRRAEHERQRTADERQNRRAITFALVLLVIVVIFLIAMMVAQWGGR